MVIVDVIKMVDCCDVDVAAMMSDWILLMIFS